MFDSISNVNVYGLEESMIASGYPMKSGNPHIMQSATGKDFDRMQKLGNTKAGEGHDSSLKGIIVQFDWRISQVMFPQVERYHFLEIVSSQSKMHKLQTARASSFNSQVDIIILQRFLRMVEHYNTATWNTAESKAEHFQRLVYSCPMGYELTARFSTNYLQLKTIHKQRHNHKLQEWKDFCLWMETLPQFRQLVLQGQSA